jgi:hypothetical protein
MTPAPKRRWPRFSLRTLFVVVAVTSALLGWFLDSRRQFHARREAIPYIRRGAGNAARAEKPRALPFWWWVMGKEPFPFDFELPRGRFTEAERLRLQSLYPEVDVRFVDRQPEFAPSPDEVDYAEAHWDDIE